MQIIPLEFKFKGSRTYVHGTDMYNSIFAQIEPMFSLNDVDMLRLTIHSQTSRQCELIVDISAKNVERRGSSVAEFTAKGPECNVIGWLVERDAFVVERYDYDEDGIVASSQLNGKEIHMVTQSPYSPVEVTVALNKALLSNVIDDSSIKWLFTRLDLNRPFHEADTTNLRVVFANSLGNHTLTRSDIYSGTEHLGHIYFSAVTK